MGGTYQGRSTILVRSVNPCSGFEQDFDGFGIAVFGGMHQGGTAVFVGSLDVRSGCQQRPDGLGIAVASGMHQGSFTVFGCGIDVGPGGQQQADDVGVVLPSCVIHQRTHQRGPAPLVLCVDIRPCLQQRCYGTHVSHFRCPHQRGRAVFVSGVRIGAFPECLGDGSSVGHVGQFQKCPIRHGGQGHTRQQQGQCQSPKNQKNSPSLSPCAHGTLHLVLLGPRCSLPSFLLRAFEGMLPD